MENKKILLWEKPKRKMPVEEWKKISADSAPPGVYTPNMSDEDKMRWKAKLIKGDKLRVEVRKTFKGPHAYAQALFVFSPLEGKNGGITTISTNGKISMTLDDFMDFGKVLAEVGEVLLEELEKIKEKMKNKNH